MKTKIFTTILLAFLGLSTAFAQVGIGTTTPAQSAILDVESTTKGFLPPRLTTAQRNAIVNPAVGLVIYNTTVNCLQWINDAGFWFDACSKTISGTSTATTWSSNIGCNIGAGTNNSPAGVRQGAVNQTMVQGVAATGAVSVTLVANVTTVGTYAISTNTINGVTFSASGTFAATGNQTVILTASGTPTTAGNFVWSINSTPSINVYGSVISTTAPLGSSYTTHFNGIVNGVHNTDNPADPSYYLLNTYTVGQTFNNNTLCQNKPISAQGCGGVTSVTASSGRVHNTVNINGQCWLQTNLIDVPTSYSGYTTTSWTNTTQVDQGYWGYFNNTTPNGSAGWRATEPGTNEGRLYQWCAAMDASISERSRGVCPAGFHVPSDCEWMFLEHGIGMSLAHQTQDEIFPRGEDDQATGDINGGVPGLKIKVATFASGNNSTGFSVLASGTRLNNGTFVRRGGTVRETLIWSSSEKIARLTGTTVAVSIFRGIIYDGNQAGVIRCLKD